jgi:NOL1/NOP2/fmu family ribosome biogenesis protein
VGVVKKGRFEPAHALALWLDSAGRTADFPWDSKEISDYLHGQVLSGPQTGWTLVTVDGLSLGWAKGSGGQLKNHFPKGLRWV